MNTKTILAALIFILSISFSTAQTYKGLWMINGDVQINSQIVNGNSSTDSQINPKVAVSFSNNWMAGAELLIDVRSKVARVGQGLFVRHSFLKAQQKEIFTQLFYYSETQRSLSPGGGKNKFKTLKIGPGLGMLHFFNSAIGLEVSLNYNVVKQITSFNNNRKENGGFQLKAGIQYFFDGKLTKDTASFNYKTKKGDWVVGGQALLGDVYFFGNSNLIQPYAGFFISDHILLATGLNFNNDSFFQRFILGISPFGRYYRKVRRKHQIFGELNMSYNMIWELIEPKYNRSPWSGSIGVAAGYSTWILPQVSFDIKAGFSQNGLYSSGSNEWISFQRFDFCIGLQAFILNQD